MSGEHGRARKRIANSRVEWPLSLLARLFGAVVCLAFCRIATFAAEQRLPSMYGFREFCNAGGLLCYGTNLSRQISRYAADIVEH